MNCKEREDWRIKRVRVMKHKKGRRDDWRESNGGKRR